MSLKFSVFDNLRRLFGIKIYKKVSPKNVVFISGCDSGLGYNLAILCHSLNMTVISACRNSNSEGAKLLQNLNTDSSTKRMLTIELDLLNDNTILNANKFVDNLLLSENDYIFTALINNAGMMCFGEFEWQTTKQFESQIKVNLLGAMKLTKELLPLIRKHKARIINVTSHCGLEPLPGLAPYAATKAGLKFWNDAIRIEMKKYDVSVVNFVPGSFVTQSNIAARQQEYADEMRKEFTEEQNQFYGKYFQDYNDYLKHISGYKKPNELNDPKLMKKFKDAILEENPKAMYKHEPLRYTIYHFLFKIVPISIKDWLVEKFVSMPKYKKLQ